MKKTIIAVLSIMVIVCMMSGCTEKKSLDPERSAESASNTDAKASVTSYITDDGNQTATASDREAETEDKEDAKEEDGFETVIIIDVNGVPAEYSVSEIASNDEGNTTVTIKMLSNEDLGSLMSNTDRFLLLAPYIMMNGERVDFLDKIATQITFDGKSATALFMIFPFDTDDTPDELWLYPRGHSEDTDWHYQISTEDFHILRKPKVATE